MFPKRYNSAEQINRCPGNDRGTNSLKTNFFIATATILLVVTYVMVMRIQPDVPGNMAKCIPSTALVYFEQHNGFELLSQLSASALGKNIEAIDFAAVAKEIGAPLKTIAAINNFGMVVKFASTEPVIKELFGHGFALALLPPLNSPSPALDKGEFLLENLVLVAEPQQPTKTVLELLATTVNGLMNDGAWTSVSYGRHQILRISGKGQSFSLVQLDGFFLIGQNERQVRRCIDTYDEEQPSFVTNAEYLAAKNSLADPDSVLAVSLHDSKEYLAPLVSGYDAMDNPFFAQISPLLAATTGFGYSAKRSESRIIVHIFSHLDSQQISDAVSDHPLHSIERYTRLATENPMLCLWSNRLNVKQIIAAIENEIKEAGVNKDDDSRLEAITNKAFKELGLLGGEVTVVAEPGMEGSALPVPLITIFLPVDDKDTLKATMHAMLDAHGIQMKSDVYGPAEYAYWSQSPQDGLVPLYGFLDELFFVGNSQTFLHKIIDAQDHGLALVEGDLVKTIDTGLAHGDDDVLYSNNRQLIDVLKGVLNIAGTVEALENREIAKKAQVITHRILVPLLDGAKMYANSVFRSWHTANMIGFDIITMTNNPKPPLETKE